jgi:hypothetical protein
VTMVAALRHDRVTAPMLLNGAMTGEAFRGYVTCRSRHSKRSPTSLRVPAAMGNGAS